MRKHIRESLATLLLPVTALAIGCTPAPDVRLQPAWTASGFAEPESVAASEDGAFFYVSNVNGGGGDKDGNGYISRLSRDGELLEAEWARGLDAPKGMALRSGTLFVSDITALVEIDAASGAILTRHAVPDAAFLNDVAIANDGAVLVSDSGTGRIHALRDGRIETWLEAPELARINGLLAEPGRLVVATMQGLLLAVDWDDRTITRLARGLGKADGIGALADGSYVVSEWPGRLFHVDARGRSSVLLDSRKQEHYINDLLLDGDDLYLPNMQPGTVSAYRLGR